MLDKLQIIKGVECYIDENGIAQLNLEHVARGLGFVDSSKGPAEYVRWARVDKHLKEFGFATSGERPKYIPEPIFYLLAMKADNQIARDFQKVVAYDILPAIRKHGVYAVDELLDNPDLLIEAATRLKLERERNRQLAASNEQLQIELDSSKEWYSIKRVAALNGVEWKTFDWRRLKKAGKEIGLDVRKIFDANYGEVNTYHKSAWEKAYPEYEL